MKERRDRGEANESQGWGSGKAWKISHQSTIVERNAVEMGKVHVFDVYSFSPSFLPALFIEMCVCKRWTECGKAARGSSLKLKNTESVKKLICRLNQRNFELSDFSFRHSWSGVGAFFVSCTLSLVIFRIVYFSVRNFTKCSANPLRLQLEPKWKMENSVRKRDVAEMESRRRRKKKI